MSCVSIQSGLAALSALSIPSLDVLQPLCDAAGHVALDIKLQAVEVGRATIRPLTRQMTHGVRQTHTQLLGTQTEQTMRNTVSNSEQGRECEG